MKQFFLPAFATVALMVTACNDNTKTTSTEKDTASAMAPDTASTAMAGGTMMKSGLPMSSSQEVPDNGSKGTGNIDASYNKASHMLTYTVNWSGLTDKPTMAHIHGPAPKGVNAGVQHDLTGVLVKETSGKFTDSVMIDGTKLNEDSLMKGLYYINIHTPKNPGGEIRGQLDLQ